MRQFIVNFRPLLAVLLLFGLAASSNVMWGQDPEEKTAQPIIELRSPGYSPVRFDYDNLQEILQQDYFLSFQSQEDGCEIYYRLYFQSEAGESMLDWMVYNDNDYEISLASFNPGVLIYMARIEAYAVLPGKAASDVVCSEALFGSLTASPWGVRYNEDAFEVDGIYYSINENDSSTVSVTFDKYTYDPEPYNVSHHITYHGMSEITIPENITYNGNTYRVTGIDSMAFCQDYDLVRINIPRSLEFIAYQAFHYCHALNIINITDVGQWCELAIDAISNDDNPLFYAKHLYLNGEEIKDLVIPEGVERIRNNAFAYCNSIRSVTIPDMKSIGSSAFSTCDNLERVNIGKVDTVGYAAFFDCWSLREVHATSLEAWCNIYFPYTGYYARLSNPLFFAHHFYVGDEEIHDLVIPDGINSLHIYTFADCQSFTSLNIADRPSGSRVHLTSYSFFNNSNLKTANIDHAIISNAFEGCTSLEEVNIGNDIGGLSDYAFKNCTALKTVRIGDGNIVSENGYEYNTGLFQIGPNAFVGCTNLTTVVIGANVKSILGKAFDQCNRIKTLECHAVEPPAVSNANAFTCYQTANLFVPRESIEAYRTAQYWADFTHIYAMESIGDANGDGIVSISDVTKLINTLLGNQAPADDIALADVNGDGSITISDVTALISKLLKAQ